ncbi:MAG: hypothetical protein L0Z55_07650 [Planctomycetes bacterium]|nr:hypothetical protein [Planctomycetota bacterium]
MFERSKTVCAALIGCSLIATVPSIAADCTECVPRAEGAKLCAPHADQESKALAALKKELKGGDDAQARIATLESIAVLTASHANAPSKGVAETLALGFKDDEGEVRRAAVRLLGTGQHGEISRALLIDAIEAAGKEIEKNSKRLDKVYEDFQKNAEKGQGKKSGGADSGGLHGGLQKTGEILKKVEPFEKAIHRDGDLVSAAAISLIGTGNPSALAAARESLKPLAAALPADVAPVTKDLLAAGQFEDVKAVVEVVLFAETLAKRPSEKAVVVQGGDSGDNVTIDLKPEGQLYGPIVYDQLRALGQARKLPALPEFSNESFAPTLGKWFKENFPKP